MYRNQFLKVINMLPTNCESSSKEISFQKIGQYFKKVILNRISFPVSSKMKVIPTDLSPVHTSCECECEREVNLTSQIYIHSKIRRKVEHISTLLRIRCEFCDVKFAGSMNRALFLRIFDIVHFRFCICRCWTLPFKTCKLSRSRC